MTDVETVNGIAAVIGHALTNVIGTDRTARLVADLMVNVFEAGIPPGSQESRDMIDGFVRVAILEWTTLEVQRAAEARMQHT